MESETKKIRLLIVDDSFFMRKILRDIFNSDPVIDVIGEAKNGPEAIQEAAKLTPDVITMDYKMPKMDGDQVVRDILKTTRQAPVIIMISAYTSEGAEATLKSLRAGAVDFVTKPSGELSLNIENMKEEIILKLIILKH